MAQQTTEEKIASLRTSLIMRLVDELDETAECVESPIEKLMLWALLLGWCRPIADLGATWWTSDCFSTGGLPGGDPNGTIENGGSGLVGLMIGTEANGGQTIEILLQPVINAGGKNYRLDFAVVVKRWVVRDPLPVGIPVTAVGGQLYEELDRVVIDVECDGHDFHERTKEQAEHDKRRDRDLQSSGWLVARFTGAEIFRDPPMVAEQVRHMVYAQQNRAAH